MGTFITPAGVQFSVDDSKDHRYATYKRPGDVDPKPKAAPSEFDDLRVADLKDKVDELNADREDDKKIVPSGTTKADLIAALVADQAANQ